MKENRITDPIKAQAAVAFLISEGWKIDLHEINKSIPGGLNSDDWIGIANGCLDMIMEKLAENKVIPIERFKR